MSKQEVDNYIKQFPEESQNRMRQIQEIVYKEVPEATERICMGIPTFERYGKWFVHFGAFPDHIGFYPQPAGIEAFKEELKGYKTSKGTIKSPLSEPLPTDLIRMIVQYCEQQSRMKPFELLLAELSKPAAATIKDEGIESLEQLAKYNEKEMLAWPGFGKTALPIIDKYLKENRGQ